METKLNARNGYFYTQTKGSSTSLSGTFCGQSTQERDSSALLLGSTPARYLSCERDARLD